QKIARQRAEECGARAAATPAEVGRSVSVVITMLPDSTTVREVVLGDGREWGVADAAAAGTIFIDMSSSAPADTRILAAELQQRSLSLIDAPVSGGVAKAVDGTLAIITGGDPVLVETITPLLLAMGRSCIHAGPIGSAHAMKALNNYVSAAGLAAASEAVRIGSTFGIDPSVIIDVFNASTGRNNSTENKFHQFILPETFASGFSLGLMAKDLGLARDLAEASEQFAPLLERCEELWRQAAETLGSDADHTEFIRYRKS
ncbi:MAG: NAD(P)-dependent oxidoreductase, partial [Desulfofustis sp.]|nr:NAD(P)-dependent oxidoreductase [Desulfofustis sp.]